MINEDQITALAHEYAEECAKGFAPADMPNCLKNEATDILVCNAEDMLKWLSRRFCLVEKKDVEAKCQEAKERYFNPDDEIEKNNVWWKNVNARIPLPRNHKGGGGMNVRNTLKSIGNELLLIFALATFIVLVMTLGGVTIILLAMLGWLIGIDMDIFIYFTMFYIFWKVWDVLAWVVGKIADRIERKKEREYFERINRKP